MKEKRLPRIAYFCMEYGLHEELPIYAGGLGVLAGDYLKAARELELPIVGIGILWKQDYTDQYIEEGRPIDRYIDYNFEMVEPTGKEVKVEIRGETVTCKIHKVDCYGNMPLYLLDTNFPGSKHGWMTRRLYGGGEQDRVAAEIILGVGGVRALRALGREVDIYHLNEGHAVFCGLELIREKMQNQGLTFHEAWKRTRREIIFTTHTPVKSAHERYPLDFLEYMGAFNGLSREEVKEIGGDPFNMTAAALLLSYMANGVSKLHGRTTCRMWKEVDQAACIISITNGVHNPTWQHPAIRRAFEQNGDLEAVHRENKQRLIDYIREKRQVQLDPDVLLVGFARRAAPYKRSDLIFRASELINPLLEEGKLQLVFSGKAHPNDEIGKSIIEQLVKMERHYGQRVVFLENYNMEIARLMVQGCDVWLNNPRRPMEASGTSGMKAAMNGVLNLSVMDGWVGEGVQHGISGWLIDSELNKQLNAEQQDEQDLRQLYRVLLDEVIPAYYHNREHWREMMRASIDMAHWQFSTRRMIREYFDLMYKPAFEAQNSPSPSPLPG
jgi:starch phosphorylase